MISKYFAMHFLDLVNVFSIKPFFWCGANNNALNSVFELEFCCKSSISNNLFNNLLEFIHLNHM